MVTGVFIHRQAVALKSIGCEVKVIAGIPYAPIGLCSNARRRAYRGTPREDRLDGVQVHYSRYLRPPGRHCHGISSYLLYYSVCRMMRSVLAEFRPDVMHAHTVTPDGYAGLLLGQKYGIPTVCSMRGSDINLYPRTHKPLTLRLTKTVLEETGHLVAVSDALRKEAETMLDRVRDISVIYNGCDLKQYAYSQSARERVRKSMEICESEPVFLYAGSLQKSKGIYELIAAHEYLHGMGRRYRLIIAGDGEEENTLESRVCSHMGVGSVHLVGRKMPAEIPDYLSACDALVLPSYDEGMPNIVLEAMACGRPIIASRVGGIPELVEDGMSGYLVARGDAKAISHAMCRVVENERERVAMGEYARKIAESRFSWDKNAREHVEVYKEVVSRHTQSS